jgi:hypothetical protein
LGEYCAGRAAWARALKSGLSEIDLVWFAAAERDWLCFSALGAAEAEWDGGPQFRNEVF